MTEIALAFAYYVPKFIAILLYVVVASLLHFLWSCAGQLFFEENDMFGFFWDLTMGLAMIIFGIAWAVRML